MEKQFAYKKQSDGRDSWIVSEVDDKGNLLNKYMVYENPEAEKPINPAIEILKNSTPEELEEIKKLLS